MNQKTPETHKLDPPNSTPLINDNDGYLYGASCRICFETKGLLISPCNCTGTTKFIHRKCLYEWLNYANNPQQCEICLSPWNKTIYPLHVRIFYKYCYLIYAILWSMFSFISYTIFESAKNNKINIVDIEYQIGDLVRVEEVEDLDNYILKNINY